MRSGEQPGEARIVITGMGLATSLGCSVAQTWEGIQAGRVGLGPMPAIESKLPDGAIGGQAAELPPDFAPNLPREARYLRWVIMQALANAGLTQGGFGSARAVTMLGTTLHGIRSGGTFLRTNDPGALKHFLANSVSRLATEGLGLGGLSATTCSACSSSLGAIALGVTMLQCGQADIVIAGGYDAVAEYAWAGFNSLRLVAPKAVLPFSKHRRGMMLAEGYAVTVLEREADARSRGADPIAYVAGWGESADAHHLTQPDPKGMGAARAMREALGRAQLTTTDISMIAAHATATPDNDAAEYTGFREVFGEGLAAVPVVGFKSYLGHTLGGAGAVELILSACALRAGWIPPCATVVQDDIEFEGLRVAPPGGLARPLAHTLNTSLGFGGANTCVILGKAHPQPFASARPPAPDEPDVVITGYGIVLPGINDAAALVQALSRESGLAPLPGVQMQVSDEQLATILNVRRMRRLSVCVKLMLASVAQAIRHAGLSDDRDRLARASALLASTHGSSGFCSEYYSQIVAQGVEGANPVLFAEGVPNAAAAHVSMNMGIKGACQTIIGSRTAGLDALGLAAMRIRSGASDLVVVGAAEETHASVDRAYRHFQLHRGEDAGMGFFTSPGSVAIVVESARSAQARGATPIARLGRFAAVSAASATDASGNNGRALDAPRRVLEALQTDTTANTAILGSGNGTWIDRAELIAFRRSDVAVLATGFHERTGDLFAAGPLLALVHSLETRRWGDLISLCTDFTGTASGLRVQPITPHAEQER